MKISHLIPHTGGGVGRAVVEMVGDDSHSDFAQTFWHLARPEDSRVVAALGARGHNVLIEPSWADLQEGVAESDVLVVHWWHYPGLFRAMNALDGIAARVVVWSHVSGIHAPLIPLPMAASVDSMVCSANVSATSLKHRLDEEGLDSSRVTAVSSLGDMSAFLGAFRRDRSAEISYSGTIDFSKLRRDLPELLASTGIPSLSVTLMGNPVQSVELSSRAAMLGRPGLFSFPGWQLQPSESLRYFGIFLYLLDGAHYGTTENALIEAMAMGLVPIVWSNPIEESIVQNGVNGFCVSNVHELADALHTLSFDIDRRKLMAQGAHDYVKLRVGTESSQRSFREIFTKAQDRAKQEIHPMQWWGVTPDDWLAELAHQGCNEATCLKVNALKRFWGDASLNAERDEVEGTWNRWLRDPGLGRSAE